MSKQVGVIVNVKLLSNGKVGFYINDKKVKDISAKGWDTSRNGKSEIVRKIVNKLYGPYTLYGWSGFNE